MFGDRAGHGAGEYAAAENVRDRAVEAQGDALVGQRYTGADDVAAEVGVPGRVNGPFQVYDGVRRRLLRWLSSGSGAGGEKPCDVGAVQPGRQGLDPVTIQVDVDVVQPDRKDDGASGQRGAQPDPLPCDPRVP
ncbi:MAG TPA: hypothetical protein VHJ18_29930 [Streptosporangiaceae bacterium]|nr:hypothetical protein [Streptosporangiaceae bacterium]